MASAPPMSTFRMLRSHIDSIVARWSGKTEKPPYTLESLVVMAIVAERETTEQNAYRWICENFFYYRQLSYQLSWSRPGQFYPSPEAAGFKASLREVYSQFEVPLKKIQGDAVGVQDDTDIWTVTSAGALAFLTDHLPIKQTPRHFTSTPFRFLDLPTEMRVAVYEHVFTYPNTGISILDRYCESSSSGNRAYRKVANLLTRYDDDVEALEKWIQYKTRLLNADPLATILALLLVNKQIYNEANATFFIVNTFVYTQITDLRSFLIQTPSLRRNHITKLAFSYGPFELEHGPRTFKLLRDLDHLQELTIHINEKDWLELEKAGLAREKKYKDVLKIPGLRQLKALRGLKKITFVGDCDKIREYLQSAMTRPKKGGGKGKRKTK